MKSKRLEYTVSNLSWAGGRATRGREASPLTLPQGRGSCSAPCSIGPGTAAFCARVVRTGVSALPERGLCGIQLRTLLLALVDSGRGCWAEPALRSPNASGNSGPPSLGLRAQTQVSRGRGPRSRRAQVGTRGRTSGSHGTHLHPSCQPWGTPDMLSGSDEIQSGCAVH